eukprot:Sdes_comp18133_c0_seq2m7603
MISSTAFLLFVDATSFIDTENCLGHFIYKFYQSIVKPFFHWITGTCEIYQLCTSSRNRNNFIRPQFERALKKSRALYDFTKDFYSCNSELPQWNARAAVGLILKIKKIPYQETQLAFAFSEDQGNAFKRGKFLEDQEKIQFLTNLVFCVKEIKRVNDIQNYVNFYRTIKYDEKNEGHEGQLMLLWSLLQPHQELSHRISHQWESIGFQGNNPATDFRGMGLLGLNNLLYFASNYNDIALSILSVASHPVRGYSFAIVGINLTAMLVEMLCGLETCSSKASFSSKGMKNILRNHFFNKYLSETEKDAKIQKSLQKFAQLYDRKPKDFQMDEILHTTNEEEEDEEDLFMRSFTAARNSLLEDAQEIEEGMEGGQQKETYLSTKSLLDYKRLPEW